MHTFFCKKLRSSLSTESFLAFCYFEYTKFLNSFLTGKRKHGLCLKTNNNTFNCGLHSTVRVCTTKRAFSEHVFIKINYSVFKIMILKMNNEFLNLYGLSTESFLEIWPSQDKFLTNESLIKKKCVIHVVPPP